MSYDERRAFTRAPTTISSIYRQRRLQILVGGGDHSSRDHTCGFASSSYLPSFVDFIHSYFSNEGKGTSQELAGKRNI